MRFNCLSYEGRLPHCLLIVLAASGANAAPSLELLAGETVRGTLSGCGDPATEPADNCEVHRYPLAVTPGSQWLLTVDQLGIDTVVTLRNDVAGVSTTVSTPLGGYEYETLLFDTSEPGDYVVEIASDGFVGQSGDYEIRLEELQDPARTAALEKMTAAAALYWLQEDEAHDEALALYEEAIHAWREIGADAEEARALYCFATIRLELEDYASALSAQERALALYRKVDQLDRASHLLSDIGLVYSYTGSPEKAHEALTESLALHEAAGDRAEVATALNNLGLVWHYKGDLEVADEYYRAALAGFREIGDLKAAANTLNNIGGIHYVRGEPGQALSHFQQSAAAGRRIRDRETEINALGNIAALSRFTGYLQDSLSANLTVLGYARERSDDAAAARALDRIGGAYHSFGRLNRAAVFLEAALKLQGDSGDLRRLAITRQKLGLLHLSRGKPSAALEHFREAGSLREQLGDEAEKAAALIGESRAEIDRLEQVGGTGGDAVVTRAAQLLDSALEIARRIGDRRQQALALQHRGAAALRAGNTESGRTDLEDALKLHRAVGNKSGEAQTLYIQARMTHASGDLTDALAKIRAASSVIESMDEQVRDPELGASLFSFRSDIMELHIELLMSLNDERPLEGYDTMAFELADVGRARALRQLHDEAAAGSIETGDDELESEWQRWRSTLTDSLTRQRELMSQTPGSREALLEADLDVQIALSMLELTEDKARRLSLPDGAANETRVTVDAIREHLDDDTVLLLYGLGRDRSFLWSVDRSGLESHELVAGTRIDEMARAVHESLSTSRPFRDSTEESRLRALSQAVLPPSLQRTSKRRLVIVADRLLHYVPFSALPLESTTDGENAQARLIDRFEIAYLPSASLIRNLRNRPPQASTLSPVAVFADPVFNNDDRRLGIPIDEMSEVSAYVSDSPVERSVGDTLLTLDRLPGTRREAEIIGNLAGGDAMIALDFDANRDAVLGDRLRDFALIHFATHGFADAQRPQLSGLALSMVGPDGDYRAGYLGLRDIHDMNLSAQLVVLSGCRTALGEEIRSEGLIGLTRAFMYAGVPRVVATLWAVPDRPTAALMEHFYHGLFRQRLTPAAALRQAQQTLMRERQWRDPHIWAAFVLQGDWK